MNILTTGATGFIGENAAKHLCQQGHSVFALVREGSNIEYVDNRIGIFRYNGHIDQLSNYMAGKKIDVVIHIASMFVAEHYSEQVGALVDSNVKFGTQLLEAMTIAGVKKFINTSSTWQHFEAHSANYCPANLYAATKEAFEKIVDYYVQVEGVQAITLSIFDSYGCGDRRGKLISLLDKFATELTELNMSGGEQQIGLTHIDDIVRGYEVALQQFSDGHSHYVLQPNKIYTLREIIEIFENCAGKKLNINWGARPYRSREVMQVWRCGEVLPGWSAQISIEDGIKAIFLVK